MPPPRTIVDGSFNSPVQMGAAKWSYPFFDRGDSVSFEYTAAFWQDQSTYVRLPVGSTLSVTQPGVGTKTCYLVNEGPAQDKGNGILEVQRVYASLPVTRQEGGSINYVMEQPTVLYIYGMNYVYIPQVYYLQIPRIWGCLWQYEYFTQRPYPLVAPRIDYIAPPVQYEYPYFWYVQTESNPDPFLPATQNIITENLSPAPIYFGTHLGLSLIPAQESSVDVYKGNIYVRKTPLINLQYSINYLTGQAPIP